MSEQRKSAATVGTMRHVYVQDDTYVEQMAKRLQKLKSLMAQQKDRGR
ncbi:MAG: hypothetical protein OXR62_14845 [Ahrensia sp.]|nr:hypothetical protein [Ahrensia sp.]